MRRLLVIITLLGAAIPASPALAAVPNDDIADAPYLPIPYTNRGPIDLWSATLESGEPTDCITPGAAVGNMRPRTVWYRLSTPTDQGFVGSAWPYSLDAILAQDQVSIGAFRRTGEALQLLSCSRPTAPISSTERLRVQVANGEEIFLQVVCRCAWSGLVSLDLTWAAPNDRRGDATSIQSLPFSDDGIFLNHATVDDEEPSHCRNGPFGVPSDPIGTVWYEYVPPIDEQLRVTTRRPTDGVELSIFESVGDSLRLVACVGGKQQDEHSEHRFDWGRYQLDAGAGRIYLFQIHTWALSSQFATITLDHVPGYDLNVEDLVAGPGETVQPSMTVSFRYGADNAHGFVPSADHRLLVCPRGQPDAACAEIANDHLSAECCGWESRWVSHRFGTTGCTGDWEIRVVLLPWYDVDPDLIDNERRVIVGIPPTAGSGIGVGWCEPVLL